MSLASPIRTDDVEVILIGNSPAAGAVFYETALHYLAHEGFARFCCVVDANDKSAVTDLRFKFSQPIAVIEMASCNGVKEAIDRSNQHHFLVIKGPRFFGTDFSYFLSCVRRENALAVRMLDRNDESEHGETICDLMVHDHFSGNEARFAEKFGDVGIYYFSRSVLRTLAEQHCQLEYFLPMLFTQGKLQGVLVGGSTIFGDGIQEVVDAKPDRRPVLFLDRDGVVIKDKGYLYLAKDVEFCDGIFQLVAAAQQKNYRVIVVTNQSGIARDHFSVQDLKDCMDFIGGEFAKRGLSIDGWYYCPYHPDYGSVVFRHNSFLRKPLPGMLLQAAADFAIDFRRSIMVGDKESDQILLPGLQTVLVPGEYEIKTLAPDTKIFTTLFQVCEFLRTI